MAKPQLNNALNAENAIKSVNTNQWHQARENLEPC